jgi:hypothetical protein
MTTWERAQQIWSVLVFAAREQKVVSYEMIGQMTGRILSSERVLQRRRRDAFDIPIGCPAFIQLIRTFKPPCRPYHCVPRATEKIKKVMEPHWSFHS